MMYLTHSLQKPCVLKVNIMYLCFFSSSTCPPMEKTYQSLMHQNLSLWNPMMTKMMFRMQLVLSHQHQLIQTSPRYIPEPHLLSQSELNDLVRDLELPKNKAELLGYVCKITYLCNKTVTLNILKRVAN